jgi:hypothetical protein
MAGYTALSDDQVLIGVLYPATHSSSSANTGWINAGYYKRFQAIITVGVVGSGESITATVQQATSSTGAGAKAMQNPITLSTAITASNQAAVINVNSQSFDANNGFSWVEFALTFTTSGTTAAAETYGNMVVLGDPQLTPPIVGAGPTTGSLASQIVGAGVSPNDY